MKRLICIILTLALIFSNLGVLNINAETLEPTEPTLPAEHEGVVSLDGKKIMIVGNSMVYYGNCVIYGDAGEEDKGYFYQLIAANGEDATVIDHTYSGKKLDYIYEHYISKLDPEELSDVDYLVLSEGNQYNDNLLGTVEKYLELFPEDVEFRFLRQPMMFEPDPAFNLPCLIEGVEALREAGYIVVDWGKLVYDIYSGAKEVPDAKINFKRSSFMKENLGYKNGDGTVHAANNDGDRNHENPLSGYVTAQMLYTSITNRSAQLSDYQFCYDTSIHPYFNIDNFAKVHYTGPEKTNFHEIFRSPQDMLGLQKLIDEYLIAEGRHPLTVQNEVKPTCVSNGLTLGSYCNICDKTIDQQQFVPVAEFGEHDLDFKNSVAPTCTKNGKTAEITCKLCGETITRQELIAATGHVTQEKITKASTSSNGSIEQICLYCNKTIESKTIKKIASVKLSTTLYTYNGKARKPSVTVTDSDGYKLKKDTDYTVTYPDGRTDIGNYTVTVKFKGNYKGTKKLTFKIRPGAVSGFKAEILSSKSVKLSWGWVDKATHYRIYKYNSSTKAYDYVATTQNTNIKLTNLANSTKFKYRIRAFTKIGNTNYYSAKYKYVTTLTKPTKASIKSAASTKKKTATLSWKSVARAEGYQITYSASKSFKNAKSITVSKAGVTKTTIKNLKSGKKYYFKVRAYRKLSGKKIYGAYSKVKSKKIK